MGSFVHLHVHTEYSLKEGALRIRDAVRRAADLGMPALAITDTNAMYGAVAFYRAAREAGIKPILGVQLSVLKDADAASGVIRPADWKPDHAVLLAENEAGYQNLVRLVTAAQAQPRFPFVTFEDLSAACDGLIALVGGGESQILKRFASGQDDQAEAWLTAWQAAIPAKSQLYIDVQDHALTAERQGLPRLIRYARQQGLSLCATNDVHYLERTDAEIQRVLAQLDNDPTSTRLEGDRYELASAEEMARRFTKLPEAIENACSIADRCSVVFPQNRVLQPVYPTTSQESAITVLRRAAEIGVKQRYGRVTEETRNRLEYELSVIERMGFADYFLVVADFIRYAHKQGISTGPGRGSAAGSLVAYALRITDVDPLSNHLLFERFLNPERVSWPDIDTDFEYERRNEVIAYVVQRYGQSHVAQIGTFGTLAARAAVRDAGRVLQVDPKLVDRLAKLIPSAPGITLEKAHEEVQGIASLATESPIAAKLWDTACALEGFPRHTSVHAAGVVISPIPLTDVVPVQPGSDGTPVTQYPMDDIEYLGLIKMDFLGLKTLTLIDRTLQNVETRTGRRLDWKAIPDDDSRTFAMLTRGETEGCFQLESSGVRRVLRDLKPTHLEDIIAVISLYRPGPMENIPAFIAAKHGRAPVRYPHPDLAAVLADTYGVIVYQEQIMQIASLMAGFTLGQADLLRRAVSKKKRDVLDAERTRFVEGCQARGYETDTANEVYDLIVRFADYGFNRSHAAAYAVLAYRTAYLRANYLPDFLAALLTMWSGMPDKEREYIRDAKAHRIQVLPPSVTHSDANYTVQSDSAIRIGLLSVRNVGRSAVDAILSARQDKPFGSLVDFLQRVNARACNKKAVESLLAAGAFEAFLPDGTTSEVGGQLLTEAYALTEERRQTGGLGLQLAPSDAPNLLYIRYSSTMASKDVVNRVKQVLTEYPGAIRVAVYNQDRRKLRLLDTRWSVTPDPDLIANLEELVGLGNVRVGPVSGAAGAMMDHDHLKRTEGEPG